MADNTIHLFTHKQVRFINEVGDLIQKIGVKCPSGAPMEIYVELLIKGEVRMVKLDDEGLDKLFK